MKHKATKQILSILLAMIMLVGMLPTTALAEDKTAWDVSLTAPECMNLPELDNPTYPPYHGFLSR